MITKIPVIIDERGGVKKETTILAMENENLSKTLSIILPISIIDKWLYIEFEKADGTKFVTPRLTAVGGYLEYSIKQPQTDLAGKLICQVIAKNESGVVWKSNKFDFLVPTSINATEEVAASNPDILADLQKQIDNIEVGGGADLTNYYAKSEVDSLLSGKQSTLTAGTNITIVDNVISATGGGGAGFESIETTNETRITLEPYKYKVINITGNSLTLTFSDVSEGYRVYQFEIGLDRVAPTFKITNSEIELPEGFVLEKYNRYQCEVINNKFAIRGIYNNYPYKWIFGLWTSSDYTTSYNFKEDLTCVQVISGTSTDGTYEINESDTAITISVTVGDAFLLFTKNQDGTITANGVVYTKLS